MKHDNMGQSHTRTIDGKEMAIIIRVVIAILVITLILILLIIIHCHIQIHTIRPKQICIMLIGDQECLLGHHGRHIQCIPITLIQNTPANQYMATIQSSIRGLPQIDIDRRSSFWNQVLYYEIEVLSNESRIIYL